MALNLQNLQLRISAGRIDQFPKNPICQVAFSGRSNVGKSSLINTMLNRKNLARVSSAPGKTITINFYEIDQKLFFVDLPGYGFARRSGASKEGFSRLTDGYFTKNPHADLLSLVIQLIDGRAGITADDAIMLDFLRQTEIPFVIVMTKTDKLNKTEYTAALEAIHAHPSVPEGCEVLSFSSLKKEGKTELWKCISAHTGVTL